MKASLKFREDQKPLFRAKVPINVVGLPFQSGVSAGESKELCLNLCTFFESWPSLKVSYRPNDSLNHFSLIIKTGIGPYGSPNSTPMTMSAEFNLLGRGNPSFFLHFKPYLGDFSIKKSQSSVFAPKTEFCSNGAVSDDDGSIEVVELMDNGHFLKNGTYSSEKPTVFPLISSSEGGTGMVDNMFSGLELRARTVLPVKNGAVLRFQWGLKLPAARLKNLTAATSSKKLPLLLLNKIAIERVANDHSKQCIKDCPRSNEISEECFCVNRQLQVLQAENGLLRKAIDDLRSEIFAAQTAGGHFPDDYSATERRGRKGTGGKIDWGNRNEKKSSEYNSFGKTSDGDVTDELVKAIKGGTGA